MTMRDADRRHKGRAEGRGDSGGRAAAGGGGGGAAGQVPFLGRPLNSARWRPSPF